MMNLKSGEQVLDRKTYYRMSPKEVSSVDGLNASALKLLYFIKSIAPFGKKVMFTDDLNRKTIEAASGLERTTFWRAKKKLISMELIEFNNHYILDKSNEAPLPSMKEDAKKVEAAPVSEPSLLDLPIFKLLSVPNNVATLQQLLQSCNNWPPEPAPRVDPETSRSLYTEINKRTTRHTDDSQSPPKPVVSPFRYADQKQEIDNQPLPLVKAPRLKPAKQKEPDIGPFAQLKAELEAIGVSFNKNLLKVFHQAGFDRVRQAIDYVKQKLEESPGSIFRIGGYLIEIIRSGENLTDGGRPSEQDEVRESGLTRSEKKVFTEWFNWAKEQGYAEYSLYHKPNDCIVVGRFDDRNGPIHWQEAMAKNPKPST